MPVTDYSKWDHIDDSDDEESPADQGRIVPQRQHTNAMPQPSGNETQTAQVTAGFIIRTVIVTDEAQRVPAFINVCSSTSVAGQLSAAPASQGLDATLPFIVGDLREDVDADGAQCCVVECMFHPATLAAFDHDKRSAETVITTALNVVSEHAMPVEKGTWSLFEPDALRETNGRYFFPPGKLRAAVADDDLTGVE